MTALQSAGQVKDPARAGSYTGGMSSDASSSLLSLEALSFAAQVRQAQRAQMKDKSYRATPVGGEVGRFLRAYRWSNKSESTLLAYEDTLSKLAYAYAHFTSLDEFTIEDLRDFLDEKWGEAMPTTRARHLAAINSFFNWAVEEGRGVEVNPAARIKRPKRANVERQGYAPAVIETLRRAQPTLRDQIGIQLLGMLGLRRNELRLLRLQDFDLGKGTVLVHGKGGKVSVMPLGFASLKTDLELHMVGRDLGEYLLYPKGDTERPMDPASVHRWFKTCLERAGLPASMKPHEMRHSAADNLWRATGNMILAQQLLRHESPATTAAYLHPSREDLSEALAEMQVLRSDEDDSA